MDTTVLGKRKEGGPDRNGPPAKQPLLELPAGPSCVHETALPQKYDCTLDPDIYGTLENPSYSGPPAKSYPFQLDPFQQIAVSCLERGESVVVSAHTSAGKTAVAEYAIAMAFRDKQKVLYTSPIKALSNQKYRELSSEFSDVGLLTGDVTLSPNASCLVMTTEILRGMLYRGAEMLREVAWVVFDEIHYMRDRERGVVWEESIIFLPSTIKMVFLSATITNAREFAEWVCHLHKQPCHVVYTDSRPVPLQHYAFPKEGQGLYLVVDEKGHFKEDNFRRCMALLEQQSLEDGDAGPAPNSKGPPPGKAKAANGQKNKPSDLCRIIKMIREKKYQPAIVFSFSRRECEGHARELAKLRVDFNNDEEKKMVSEVFESAIESLSPADRALPAVEALRPHLLRGVGVHHSGLLPILKETVEILFGEGLVKTLFATETFAMGLNMPAKTVVFTAISKWDGEGNRYMASSEYIQMSGRAGRRGKDERGISILMLEKPIDITTCRELIQGKPAPLLSSYKLSYYTLLNLMARSDGTVDTEHVIRSSFHQFQHDKMMPQLEEGIKKLEDDAAAIDVGEGQHAELAQLHLRLGRQRDALNAFVMQPEHALKRLEPGRVAQVVDGPEDWGWGMVVAAGKGGAGGGGGSAATAVAAGLARLVGSGMGGAAGVLSQPASSSYMVDVLILCMASTDGGRGPVRPCPKGAKGEWKVVPVPLSCVRTLSACRLTPPTDLRAREACASVGLGIQALLEHHRGRLPLLDPAESMGLGRSPEFVRRAEAVEAAEEELHKHPLFQDASASAAASALARRVQLEEEAAKLRLKLRDNQLSAFRDELRARTAVLRRLGHVSAEGVVELKGRAAALIDTGDELLLTELMFEGALTDLDAAQTVAVLSCFVPVEKSKEKPKLAEDLDRLLTMLHDTAFRIAEVQKECKLEIDPQKYVEGFQPTLMDVVYNWAKGRTFVEVSELTDMFEGSIIRAVRRLDELVNQMAAAARAVGDEQLEKKFLAGSESIKRGIMFANSLYI